ncbi:MAG: PIG-L family deacetylase [Anaerolineae bacterium]|nr:PIG-L family deacetylase [Anaerolineae bacterium]
MHLFLSPHADDVVLSCGGWLAQLVQHGESVTVLTVMAADMPPDVPPHPFVEEHIVRWQLGADPAPGRRTEDQRALDHLGSAVQWGPFPDALYRTDGQGTLLYPDLGALFGVISPHDPVLQHVHTVTNRLKTAQTVYAPLGAGAHVDHQLVRDMVLEWFHTHNEVAVFFYEEYPYSAEGAHVIETALAACGVPMTPIVRPMSQTTLDTKIAAIACYESQISTFWADVKVMEEAVRQYAVRVGRGHYAERFWQPDYLAHYIKGEKGL